MLFNNNEYFELVEQVKQEILTAQYKASLSLNQGLVLSCITALASVLMSIKSGVISSLIIWRKIFASPFREPRVILCET